jgi:hypothetical protein
MSDTEFADRCLNCGSGLGTQARGSQDSRFCRACDDALVADELRELRDDRRYLIARAEKAETALVARGWGNEGEGTP